MDSFYEQLHWALKIFAENSKLHRASDCCLKFVNKTAKISKNRPFVLSISKNELRFSSLGRRVLLCDASQPVRFQVVSVRNKFFIDEGSHFLRLDLWPTWRTPAKMAGCLEGLQLPRIEWFELSEKRNAVASIVAGTLVRTVCPEKFVKFSLLIGRSRSDF